MSGALPTTTMRFGAFPSSDVFKCDGGGSVQQVSSRTKPAPNLGRRFERVDAIVFPSGQAFAEVEGTHRTTCTYMSDGSRWSRSRGR